MKRNKIEVLKREFKIDKKLNIHPLFICYYRGKLLQFDFLIEDENGNLCYKREEKKVDYEYFRRFIEKIESAFLFFSDKDFFIFNNLSFIKEINVNEKFTNLFGKLVFHFCIKGGTNDLKIYIAITGDELNKFKQIKFKDEIQLFLELL